jgi:hypothetical protein
LALLKAGEIAKMAAIGIVICFGIQSIVMNVIQGFVDI